MNTGELSILVQKLLSYEENDHREVLEKHFAEDAKLSHPLLTVVGTHNIRKVFRVWTSLNAEAPTFRGAPVSDGKDVVVLTTQHLRPRIFPFLHLSVPAQTILRFREESGGRWVIYCQEDSWTLDGLIQSVPLVAWWYENVVRVVMGKLVSGAGSFLYTANQATTKLQSHAGEISSKSFEAFSGYQAQGISYIQPYSARVSSIVGPIKDTTQQRAVESFNYAQELVSPYAINISNVLVDSRSKASALATGVFSQVSKMRGANDSGVH